MQELTFINSKSESINITSFPPFIFWKISGLEMPSFRTYTSQYTGQNGTSYYGGNFEPRIITISFHIHGKNNYNNIQAMYEIRQKLNNIINPLLNQGELRIINDYGIYKINAIATSEKYLDKTREYQTLEIEFFCPNPFFQSLNKQEIGLSYIEGGMTFPLKTPVKFGILGYMAKLINHSGIPLPLEIFITGGGINPILTNKSTGEFIKLQKDIAKDEILYINSDTDILKCQIIQKNGTRKNAFGYLTNDSVLFKAKAGENTIIFSSDDDSKNIKIQIFYYKLFIGI